ncbi:hypothetical protein IWQ62_006454, partial [Dispira parvispora]
SRQIHENGKRHKENVGHFLRNVDRRAKAEYQEEQATKSTLAEIEQAALQQYHQDVGYSEHSRKDQDYSLGASMALPMPTSASQQDPVPPVGSDSVQKIPLAPSLDGEDTTATPGEWQIVESSTRVVHTPQLNHVTRKRTLEHDIATGLGDSASAARQPSDSTHTKSRGDKPIDPDDLYRFQIREKQLPTQDPVVDLKNDMPNEPTIST